MFLEEELDALVLSESARAQGALVRRKLGFDGRGGSWRRLGASALRTARDNVELRHAFVMRSVRNARLRCATLEHALDFVAGQIPAPAQQIEDELAKVGLSKAPFRLEGLLHAAWLLERQAPFSLVYRRRSSRGRIAVQTGLEPCVEVVRKVALQLVAERGVASCAALRERASAAAGQVIDRQLTRAVLAVEKYARRLGADGEWFLLLRAWLHGNPLLRLLRELTRERGGVDVTTFEAAVQRELPQDTPPIAVLLEMCSVVPGFVVEPGRIVRRLPIEAGAAATPRPRRASGGVERQYPRCGQPITPLVFRAASRSELRLVVGADEPPCLDATAWQELEREECQHSGLRFVGWLRRSFWKVDEAVGQAGLPLPPRGVALADLTLENRTYDLLVAAGFGEAPRALAAARLSDLMSLPGFTARMLADLMTSAEAWAMGIAGERRLPDDSEALELAAALLTCERGVTTMGDAYVQAGGSRRRLRPDAVRAFFHDLPGCRMLDERRGWFVWVDVWQRGNPLRRRLLRLLAREGPMKAEAARRGLARRYGLPSPPPSDILVGLARTVPELEAIDGETIALARAGEGARRGSEAGA